MFPVDTVEYMVGCVFKYQTCEAGRSKMCFCLVWCLLSCSTGGGGPACFNIEKVVFATIIMRKKSYPFAKPKLQGVVLNLALGPTGDGSLV
jgi:hypothetical protein